MRVIKPTIISGDVLVSSSISEDEYQTYSTTKDYVVFEKAIYANRVWECVQTPNIGHTPGTDALYWALSGVTNKWAMFDDEISTASVAQGSLVATIAPGLVNSIALLEIDGTYLNITVRDGDGGEVVYNHDKSLDGSVLYDWLQYFYDPFIAVHQVVLTDLPLYGNAHITVTLTSGGAVRVGTVATGLSMLLGDVEQGASASIIDYSRKETSATGTTTFVKRRYSKRMSVRMLLDNYALNNFQRTLSDLRATPCVWVATDDAGYEPLTIFGFYRDFSIDVSYPTNSYCSLEIEGLA